MDTEQIVREVQEGREDLIAALWAAVEKYVRWQARRFYSRLSVPPCDVEDLYQAGFLAVVEAVKNYDPGEASFITFLWYHLRRAFQDTIGIRRRADASNHTIRSLDEPLNEEEDFCLLDTIEDPAASEAFADCERRIFNEQLHRALENALQTLDKRDAELIRQIYFEGNRPEGNGVEVRRKNAIRNLRRPALTKELRQYLDDVTTWNVRGFRPTENAAIVREEIEGRLLKWGISATE